MYTMIKHWQYETSLKKKNIVNNHVNQAAYDVEEK